MSPSHLTQQRSHRLLPPGSCVGPPSRKENQAHLPGLFLLQAAVGFVGKTIHWLIRNVDKKRRVSRNWMSWQWLESETGSRGPRLSSVLANHRTGVKAVSWWDVYLPRLGERHGARSRYDSSRRGRPFTNPAR